MSKPNSKPAEQKSAGPEVEVKPAAPITVITTNEDLADFAQEAEGSSPYARTPEVETKEFGNGTTEQHYV